MITETREIYKCEHCRKLYQRKHAAIKHELTCNKNPDNERDCHNCFHLDKKEYVHTDYYGDDTNQVKYNFFHCDLINSFLYPPKCEIKGNQFNIIDNNKPMPRVCKAKERYNKMVDSMFSLM